MGSQQRRCGAGTDPAVLGRFLPEPGGGAIPRWDITSLVYADGAATFEWAFTCTGSWGEASFDGATVARFRDDRIASLREYRCTEPPFDAHPA